MPAQKYWKMLHVFSYLIIVVFGALILRNKYATPEKKPMMALVRNMASRGIENFVDKSFSQKSNSGKEFEVQAGYFKEAGDFKACILYPHQGLDDLQQSYISKLNSAGYRVLSYEGLSEGSKDSHKTNEDLAQAVWQKVGGDECSKSKKLAVGWSQSRSTAYHLASNQQLDAVVLAAPGVDVKWAVGEADFKTATRAPQSAQPKTVPQQAREAIEFFNHVVVSREGSL